MGTLPYMPGFSSFKWFGLKEESFQKRTTKSKLAFAILWLQNEFLFIYLFI
jgi:hypothetical protein